MANGLRSWLANAGARPAALGSVMAARYMFRQAVLLWAAADYVPALAKATRSLELLLDKGPARIDVERRELCAVAITLGSYHNALCEFGGAVAVYRCAMSAIEHNASAGPVWAQLATALADTQRRQGDLSTAETTLQLTKRRLGQGPALTRGDLHNVWGIVCKDSGRYGEALEHYRIARDLYPPTDLERHATLQHNLAGLSHVRGDYAAAETPAREAVRLRQLLGGNSLRIAADKTVLGAVHAGLGNLDESEDILREALGVWRERFGENHYEAAVIQHNLASIDQQRGQAAEAEREFRNALCIKTDVLGPTHPEVASILNNLGVLYAEEGRTSDARQAYVDALSIFTARLGTDHPATQQCTLNLTRLRRSPDEDQQPMIHR
jgi:tetratricopeptide (TPR) repeat protein